MGLPPASARTLSLYTGRTDLEDPDARDGTRAGDRKRKRVKRIVWSGGLGRWWVGDEATPKAVVTAARGGSYVATVGGESQTFDHVALAGAWVEEKLR